MNNTNYWEQFLNTGKVDDYLSFKTIKEEYTPSGVSKTGENPYAGLCDSNRNDYKDNTSWRV
ncbi:MAG TPA: hypothetical protein VJZ04_11385 [Lachnospiraceae bacterium]|nr:hypothetical protein [Lachnospiraceae bacterium]